MTKNKIAIIPAAGKGSRLGLPFSKELLPIFTKDSYYPIIQSSIDNLKKIGIYDFIFIVNSKKSDIIDFLGNGERFDCIFKYVIQNIPQSLPHAIFEAVRTIKDEEVYFLMPDTLIEPTGFLDFFEKNKSLSHQVNLGCFITQRPDKFAMVKTDKNNNVLFMEEKNTNSRLEYMWGFWHWKKDFSSFIRGYDFNRPTQVKSELTLSAVADLFVQKKQIFAVKMNNYTYRDLGTIDEINNYIFEINRRNHEI